MKQFILVILLLTTLQVNAQLGIKFLHFNPTGDQGLLFEKRFTAELLWINEFDEDEHNLRGRFGLSYIPLEARMDTFPSYATVTGGNGTKVLPGYEIYEKYNMGYIFVGMDWAFVHKDPFFAYLGADVLVGGINMKTEAYYETYTHQNFEGGQYLGGLRFRAGAQYMLTQRFSVFGELSRSYYLISETGGQSHYDYGLGVLYMFRD